MSYISSLKRPYLPQTKIVSGFCMVDNEIEGSCFLQ